MYFIRLWKLSSQPATNLWTYIQVWAEVANSPMWQLFLNLVYQTISAAIKETELGLAPSMQNGKLLTTLQITGQMLGGMSSHSNPLKRSVLTEAQGRTPGGTEHALNCVREMLHHLSCACVAKRSQRGCWKQGSLTVLKSKKIQPNQQKQAKGTIMKLPEQNNSVNYWKRRRDPPLP